MRYVAGALVVAALAACADLTINPAYSAIQQTIADPSFRRDIMPILKQTCGASGACHAGPTAQKGLRLDDDSLAYATLVNVTASFVAMARVRPTKPDSSFMYRVLSLDRAYRFNYYRMPLSEYALPLETVETIKNWITKGALNN